MARNVHKQPQIAVDPASLLSEQSDSLEQTLPWNTKSGLTRPKPNHPVPRAFQDQGKTHQRTQKRYAQKVGDWRKLKSKPCWKLALPRVATSMPVARTRHRLDKELGRLGGRLG
jgi:hypothetical protein